MIAIDKATYAEIGRQMRAFPPEKPGISYKWEELVNRMCASDDDGLHDVGIKEHDELQRK